MTSTASRRRRRPRVAVAARIESLEVRTLLAFVIGSLSDSPDPVNAGAPLTLTAANVVNTTGHEIEIDFFRESNGIAGLQPAGDTLIDYDADSAGGYSITTTAPLSAGTYTYYAKGQDPVDGGRVSNTVTTTGTVVPAPPTIASLTDSPDPVVVGNLLTLSASGVADTDNAVAVVFFYLETNGTPGLQAGDQYFGFDDKPANGFGLTFSTTGLGLTPGTYTYYAVAQDVTGLKGPAVSTTNTVGYAPDRFEPNDSRATATDLGTMEDMDIYGLSLHTGSDVDYFKFFTGRATVLDVTLGYDASAPMTLVVYDQGQNEIARSVGGASGYAHLRIDAYNDYRYFVEALSSTGAANPLYTLRVISTPSIGSVTVNPNPAFIGAPLSVTANDVVDASGGTTTVAFYRESNGTPGLQQNDELLGEDADGTDGYGVAATAPALAGAYTYYAVARDALGYSGNVATTTHVVKYHPPTVTAFTASPYPASPGGKVTLSAIVADPDGTQPTVTFYVESNGHPGLQAVDGDQGVATDSDPSDGFSFTFAAAGMAPGTYTYYAYAEDPDTGASAAGADAPTAVTRVGRPGDANFDGAVDFNDLVVLAQNYNTAGKDFPRGDFNYDGNVDFNDLVLLAQRYNTTLPQPAPAFATLAVKATVVKAQPSLFSTTPVVQPTARPKAATRPVRR